MTEPRIEIPEPRIEVLWCRKHEASATGQTNRCLSALNAALRMGVNPFDPHNSRKFGGKCDIVPALVVLEAAREHLACNTVTDQMVERAFSKAKQWGFKAGVFETERDAVKELLEAALRVEET